ncbi:MAG: hypothetical protein CVU66_02510 [Deltaproteobacteria bacterium HGW-Deltaproteobacteria-23]|nr:MAG: hypothetical protein CVU66_02510 [Deltaproteobacteria bacterium HGW-Deltaproteobacteria-23]
MAQGLKCIMQWFMDRKCLTLLVILSLVIRFAILMVVIEHPEKSLGGDAGHYDLIARNLLAKHQFLGPSTMLGTKHYKGLSFWHEAQLYPDSMIPESLRPPLYPGFLAAIYLLFGRSVAVVLLFQNLLAVMTGIIAYKVSEKLFGNTVGIITFILITCNLGLLAFPFYLLTETLFVFLLTLAFWFLIEFLETSRKKYLLFSAVIAGASALCKPITCYLILAVMPVLVMKYRTELSRIVVYGLLYSGVAMMVISPWLIRNYLIFNHAKISSSQGLNLYIVNVSMMESDKFASDWGLLHKQKLIDVQEIIDKSKLNSMEISTITEEMGLSAIRKEPLSYLRIHLKGMVRMLIGHNLPYLHALLTDKPYNSGSALSIFVETGSLRSALDSLRRTSGSLPVVVVLIVIVRALIYMFFLYGGYRMIKTSPLYLLLFLSFIGYFVVLTGPFGIDPRFSVPIIPFINIVASFGIYSLFERFRLHRETSKGEV